ncbi:6-pyruvoyl trahydropterin synthase family protein [Thermophagus sp. OGC60D27]|uniref:6-pyruvoyl trahydropterin synthase family protein n=1 Tax=Thermophagus sp. OGC60D27 TaxID=3458415 RepID=UPI0040377BC6
MAKIRLTKEFRFEMAHALWNYNGLCKNIHGHSYILQVTVIGEPCRNETDPKLGMVMDFGDLKRIVKDEIVDKMDHSIVLNRVADYKNFINVPQLFDRIHIVPYQPTCENLLVDFAERIRARLPEEVSLFSLKLHETANSFAEWYAEDNE